MRLLDILSRTRLGARIAGRLAPLSRAQDGAVAVEFALILAPFLLLFFGLMELAVIYFAAMTLENAVVDSGRAIRTGQITSKNEAADFKALVCKRVSWMEGGCDGALRLDVRTVSTFASTNALDTPKTPCWNPGGPSSLVLVRAYYDWPVITPLLSSMLPAVNGKRVLTMATAFANEPYDASAAPEGKCPA